MSWTPDNSPQQRWLPQDEAEHALEIVNPIIVIDPIGSREPFRLDLRENVKWGRRPYTFIVDGSNMPAGTICTPNGQFYFLEDAPLDEGVSYIAVIRVRDANNQEQTFKLVTYFVGEGPLILTGTPPPAHVGVPYSWRPTIVGGTPPYLFAADGINFGEAGLVFDPSTGEISGTYNGVYGNSPGNLFAIRVWDDARQSAPIGYPNTGFDFELATTFDLLDP